MRWSRFRFRLDPLARQGRWDEAQTAFTEAISLAHALPYPYLEARSLYELGMMLAGRGDVERGANQLHAAQAIFRRLGAAKDSEQTDRALAAIEPIPARIVVERRSLRQR